MKNKEKIYYRKERRGSKNDTGKQEGMRKEREKKKSQNRITGNLKHKEKNK